MNTFKKIVTLLALPMLVSTSLPASAGLIFGTSARTQFEGYQASLGDTLQTFDSFAAQTDLRNQIAGLTFRSTYKRFVPPPGPIDQPVHVICSPSNPYSSFCSASDGTDRIISGTGTNGGATDGQSIYEIVFATPVLRAGLERIFNTFSLTRFYSGAELLAEHRNTASAEFVGFISDPSKLITRIETDGLNCGTDIRPVYCVGYSDDLFYGTREPDDEPGDVPVPATWLLLLSGLWLMRRSLSR